MDKPKEIQHLISIGFKEIRGAWCPVWGQGDGEYWTAELKRGNDVVFRDRDSTNLKYRFNGIDVTEEYLLNLKPIATMEKLKQGDIAIIDYKTFSQPKKVEVLEETETTYLLLDMDFKKGRDFIVDTNNFTEKTAKEIIDEFKKQEFTFVQPDLVEPRVEVLAAKFRITKEEFEKTYKVIEMISTLQQRAESQQKLIELLNNKD